MKDKYQKKILGLFYFRKKEETKESIKNYDVLAFCLNFRMPHATL